MTHRVDWIDAHQLPKVKPNPAYPDGIDLDLSKGAAKTCTVKLPYPAKRIGAYVIVCETCGISVGVSTAGRPDDPRSVKLPCLVLWMTTQEG